MGSKICMNASCGTTASQEWKKGWPLRSGGFANLCHSCGSAFENSVYCDTFHSEDTGWRDCSLCGKSIHCGCIVSMSSFECFDFGGVGCSNCYRASHLRSIRGDEIPNGFRALTVSNVGDLQSTPVGTSVLGDSIDEGKLLQLCQVMETNDMSLLLHTQRVETSAALGETKSERLMFPFGEVGSSFPNLTHSFVGSLRFTKVDNNRTLLEVKEKYPEVNDKYESLAQPSLSMSLGAPSGSPSIVPFSGGAIDVREQSKGPSPLQSGQKSRPILPKPLKTSPVTNSELSKGTLCQMRIARPPADGRGRNQLLPRYWPRITDQELEQLSGDLNSTIVPLFEKVLSASDAGRIGRLVLPKACAETYFPPISQSEGLPIRIQDVKGNEWTFQFRFWPNNNSRMYVLEGVTPCIQSMQLRAGDTVTFSRIDPGGKLIMGFRRATNSTNLPDAQASLLDGSHSGETSLSGVVENLHIGADGNNGLHKIVNHGVKKNENSLQRAMLPMENKRTRNIGTKNKRLLIPCEDVLELRLTWEEAQDLLRPPPNAKPSIVTIGDHEFEEYDEPPVFGKRTIFTSQPSGGQQQWAQCDDCSKWRRLPIDVLLPPKWTCSDNASVLSRYLCTAPEEISLRELEILLRGNKDCKKQRIEGSHSPHQECEPSGLDALATAAVLGDNGSDYLHGSTTKHPRHRPGCTCIVCIQPPSGKGKHKPTCTCNVCMTVKRRFKTLMLRKKKRQSERQEVVEVPESSARKDVKDELQDNGTSGDALQLQTNRSESEGSQSFQIQGEAGDNAGGKIDLNCDPNRDDMMQVEKEVGVQSTSILVQNGRSSLSSEVQTGPTDLEGSTLPAESTGQSQSEKLVSDEGCLKPLPCELEYMSEGVQKPDLDS